MGRSLCPLGRRFARLAQQHPAAPAVLAPDGALQLDRLALLRHSLELAERLRRHLQPGDVAVVSLPNAWECLAAFLAARALGVRVALVDAAAPEPERLRCAQVAGARLIVSSPFAGGQPASFPAPRVHLTVTECPRVPLPAGVAVLKFTSGSTGAPQAVALTLRQVVADAVQILKTMGLGGADRTLAAIPLTHSYGFGSCLLPLLLAGTPVVFPPSCLPGALRDTLACAHVTHFPAVPAMIRALAALPDLPPLPHLRVCLSAGAPLDPTDAAAFRARSGVKVHAFYGASECGGITFDGSEEEVMEKGRVGTPLWRVGVEVVDEAGQPCPPGVEGRVRVRSPAVASALLPPPEGESPLNAGTFLTGDMGVLGDKGLTLTGRYTPALNVAGKKVHPEEVRRTLERLPGVREAVVVGWPTPRRGDLVAALVAVDPGAGLTPAQVLAHCRAHLAPHKVPQRLRLVAELPRSNRGKVQREAVLALLRAPQAPPTGEAEPDR